MLKKNDIYEMTCVSLGQDAQGVCRHNGIVVFVPELLPGESAQVRITKVQKNFAYGRVEQRLSDSPDRRIPFCPIAKRCGGCTCQHMSYEASLEYKRTQVQELLKRVGHLDIDVPPVIGMEFPYHYRNKGIYPFGTQNGSAICGFYAARSHDIIPLPEHGCQIQDEISFSVLQTVLEWMNAHAIPAYNEHTGHGLIRHVMTRRASNGDLMVVIVASKQELPHLDILKELLCSRIPSMRSLSLSINTQRDNVILGKKLIPLWGQQVLQENLLSLSFAVSPLSFLQVNPEQTKELYRLAIQFAGLTKDDLVIDAYCGTGTISLLLAQDAGQVIGIEIVEDAVQNACQNAQNNGITNTRFIVGATEEVLPDLISQGLSPKVIVLDPPRKGCEPAVLDSILKSAPEKIVYVSCNPSTLARDLNILTQSDYSLSRIQCVDMFCWTSSVETCCLLSKL